MSNYYDVETIFDRGYQKDVASSITRGLENYLKANWDELDVFKHTKTSEDLALEASVLSD